MINMHGQKAEASIPGQPTPVTLDDFAEFLSRTYQPVLDALAEYSLTAEITRGSAAAYALIATNPATGNKAAITDGGQPLPDRLADIQTWRISPWLRPVVTMPGTTPLTDLANRIADLLA